MPTVPLPFASDHPVFVGHFPGHPIVPGVLLLDWTQRAIESTIGVVLIGLYEAKFRSPAIPGDVLELEYEATESDVRFEIRCGARKIATGRFLVAPNSVA